MSGGRAGPAGGPAGISGPAEGARSPFGSKSLQLRKEVFEFGLLPLSTLLPRLDGPSSLQVRKTLNFVLRTENAAGVSAVSASMYSPEYCFAPVQPVQRRLLANSTPSATAPERQRMVGVPAVAESLGISEAQAQIIANTLAAVAPGGPPSGEPNQQVMDAREVDMHWLLLFLFVQMYSRPHVQASI